MWSPSLVAAMNDMSLISSCCHLQHTHTHTHTHNFATFPCCQQNMANSFTKDYQPTYCHMGSRVQVFCNHVSTLLETKKKRAVSSDYLFQQHPRIQQESFRSRKVRERDALLFSKAKFATVPCLRDLPVQVPGSEHVLIPAVEDIIEHTVPCTWRSGKHDPLTALLCSKSPKWSSFATAIFSSNEALHHPTRSSSGLERCFTSLLGLWKAPTILLQRLSVWYDPHQNGLDLCYTWSWGKVTEPASICGEMRCPQLWGGRLEPWRSLAF
jgi:hypothetical protein